MSSTPLTVVRLGSVFLLLAVSPIRSAEWFVAPTGSTSNAGTEGSPWDIESALKGKPAITPGDTIWIEAGTYKCPNRKFGAQGYEVRLAGAEGKPIWVRARPGQRVTIDGGLSILAPTTWLWISDLEILLSENMTTSRRIEQTGSSPSDLNRPWSGLNINVGTGCKFINLVIHDNIQGVSWWAGSHDTELYGCIIYDDGWEAPDRGHGHAVYVQNEDGVKTISDCIMTGGYGYTVHAYGSAKAFVDHFVIEGNICYKANEFLVGGGKPSHDIKVRDNVLYGLSMRIGYGTHPNEDCEVRDNLIVNGGLTINNYERVVNEGNLILAKDDPRPSANRVIFRPNRYDARRANIAAFQWEKNSVPRLDPGDFLKKGDTFRLMNPRDFYGKPVLEGRYDGTPITLPMTEEFAAFVLLRSEGTRN